VELYADMMLVDEIRLEDKKYIKPKFRKRNLFEISHYQYKENKWL